jgi:hypothetical protein
MIVCAHPCTSVQSVQCPCTSVQSVQCPCTSVQSVQCPCSPCNPCTVRAVRAVRARPYVSVHVRAVRARPCNPCTPCIVRAVRALSLQSMHRLSHHCVPSRPLCAVRVQSRVFVAIIEHTRNAQKSLVLQGEDLRIQIQTLQMDGYHSRKSPPASPHSLVLARPCRSVHCPCSPCSPCSPCTSVHVRAWTYGSVHCPCSPCSPCTSVHVRAIRARPCTSVHIYGHLYTIWRTWMSL